MDGKKIAIYLGVNAESQSTWTHARNAMKRLIAESIKWDQAMRDLATPQLRPLANEWREQTETPIISEKEFSERMKPQVISMSHNGDFVAYYTDGNLFGGHAIVIYGSLERGVRKANIEG